MDNTCQVAETGSAAQEDLSSLEKLTQSYLSLKQRICSAHEVIKQYNDKIKECERLKTELNAMTKQAKKATFNYNTTLAKVLKLELQNNEYQKNIQTLTTTVQNHEVKIAADNQHIQQLTCKIADIEGQNAEKIIEYDLEKSSFQVRIKELEQELKTVRKSHETQIKKMEKKMSSETVIPKSKIPPFKPPPPKSTVDVAVNTMPLQEVVKPIVQNVIKPKPKLSDKSVMTKDSYSVKDNVYPVFCDKCEIEIIPAPLEKICQMMQDQCPLPVERIRSPSPKRMSSPLSKIHDISGEQCKTENLSDTYPHQSNRNNFSLTNISPPPSPIVSRQAMFFDDLIPPQMPNIMNQSKYYMPETANTHLNSNNRVDIGALNSSLSSINTLEKRISSLELKLKKQSKRNKAMENSNCWQHKRPMNCCSHEMNNSSQPNIALELMQKMLELCNRNQEKNMNLYKEHMFAKLNARLLSKLMTKKNKKLQRGVKGIWEVESTPKRVEQSCTQTRGKKRKLRQSVSHKHCSTSADTSLNFESESPYMQSPTYESTQTSPPAISKILRNSIKPRKSVSHETDSGLSSDCVESGKTPRLETDTETGLVIMEDRRSTKENVIESPELSEILCHPSIIEPLSDYTENDQIEEPPLPNESIEERPIEKQDTETHLQSEIASTSYENEYNTVTIQPGCRRRGRPPKKQTDTRAELLRKLRNLKRPRKNGANHPTITDNPNLLIDEPESCNKKPDIDIKAEVFTPRKRTRIAHAPKQTLLNGDNTTKPETQENTCSERQVTDSRVPVNEVVFDIQGILDNSDAPVSGRTRRSNVITRKRKMSNSIHESNIINTKTVEMTHENVSEYNHCKAVNNEMSINAPEKVLGNLENVTQEDINSQVLQTDSNAEQTTIACIDTASTVDSALDVCEPLIKECTSNNDISKSDDSSLCKYELQSSQVANNVCISGARTEDTVPQCINTLPNDVGNENVKDKCTESASTSMVPYVKKKLPCQIKNNSIKDICSSTDSTTRLDTPLSLAMQYANQKKVMAKSKKKQTKRLAATIRLTDGFVKDQLKTLVVGTWDTPTHLGVFEKLKNNFSARIIAKCIIEFLSSEEEYNVTLDKTYTPPAPLMTKAQQRIAALLLDLKKTYPDIMELVQAGIQYEMFRPGNVSHERSTLTSLTGMYMALARIEKDREKVRIFCFDAMYFLNFNAMTVLYTVLTSWPEVFPNCTATNEVLPKCMAHLILSQQCTYPSPKLSALKNLMSMFYQYPTSSLTKDILSDLIMKLQENPCNGLDSALILLAKRENSTWAHKNLIRGALLPLIINNKVSSMYKAFTLLGNLLRPFPKDDANNAVGEIAEQLRDLIDSGVLESAEQQEGIISALLSLSRQKFNMIAETVLKWNPSQPLSPRTKQQIMAYLRLQQPDYWRAFLKKRKYIPLRSSAQRGT